MWSFVFFLTLALQVTAFSQHIHLAATYPVITTLADEAANATYYRKHNTTSVIGVVGYGFELSRRVFTDIRYEYWVSDRKYDIGNDTYNHRLSYQTLGIDLGYSFSHPRVWWALTLGAHYPIIVKSGNFTGVRKIQYQARASLAIRVKGSTWLHFECGRRFANLGQLSDGATPYVDDAAAFDLSGPFVSFGIAFHF